MTTNVDDKYFSHIRWDIIDCIPEGGHRILEVGCGQGGTLIKIKEGGKASEIVGIEACKEAIGVYGSMLDNALIGDIETFEIPYTSGYFDYIICADVLEHLKDPLATLKKLRRFLKKSGVMIASIPNAQHIRVIWSLLKGDFKYTDAGIMDRTHLRFFCKKNILEFTHQAGFVRLEMRQNLGWKAKVINNLTLGIFKGFLVTQYIVMARAQNE